MGPEHPETASGFAHLALLAWSRGEYESAFSGFEQALTIYRKKIAPDHYIIAVNLIYQASSASRLGRQETAISLLREIHGSGELILEGLEFFGFDDS